MAHDSWSRCRLPPHVRETVAGNYVSECDPCWWHHGVDVDGSTIGEPWTCILPSLPNPDGWQDVDVVFEDAAHSMGIGVYYLTGVASAPADKPRGTL